MATTPRETGLHTTPPTVGFVGLGHMGGAMAARLLAAGHPVVGTRRSRGQADDLLRQGLQWRDEPREVAAAADVLVTSLPDDRALDTAASGADGVLAGLREGSVWVEMSTVSPRASRELAACARKGRATLLDAPVSGSVPQARAGALTIMVGGDRDAYDRVEPVLRELGSPTHVGSNGQGLVLKLAINISLAVQMLVFSEGLLLATRSGIDRDLARDVMASSAIGSPMLRARAPLIFDLPDDAWFSLALMRKDVELAQDVARGLGVPLPTADRAHDVLGLARALGYEARDLAALYQVLENTTDGRAVA
jgi:3-hydroxyisobutyrate dehydrogenase-like beta-hydroxyacid dehydrogenase